MRAIGMPLPEIARTPFSTLAKIWHEYIAIERAKAGAEPEWDPDKLPDYTLSDGSVPEDLFFAYGVSLGADPDWVREEWKRQKETRGFQSLPRKFMTSAERAAEDLRQVPVPIGKSAELVKVNEVDDSPEKSSEVPRSPLPPVRPGRREMWIDSRGQLRRRRDGKG